VLDLPIALRRPSGGAFVRTVALAGLLLALTAPAAVARNLYTTNFSTGTVSAIDEQTGQAVGEPIAVGKSPRGIAISPDGSRVYVTNEGDNSVATIDTATGKVVGAPIAVGSEPVAVAISPDGARAYVANFSSSTVSVIDTKTRKPIGKPIAVGSGPLGVAITPDGRRAYVTSYGVGTVSAIDTKTGKVVATIEVGKGLFAIAITPDGSRAYVTNEGMGSVSAIDLASNQVIAGPIKVGSLPRGVAITPDGSRAYVSSFAAGSVSVIDIATNQLVGAPIAVGDGPIGIAAAADGTRLYVADLAAAGLATIDATTNQALGAPVPLGREPYGLAIEPNQPPSAAFSATRARPGVPVAFRAAASKDPDGSIAAFDWSFGDRKTAELGIATTEHVFRAQGKYRVSLTVGDAEGCSISPIFTGQTASCNGSAIARKVEILRVSYPGVRVTCPKRATAPGCRFELQAGAMKPQSALAKVTVRPGHSAIVSLRPKPAFRLKLARAKSIAVRETVTVGGSRQSLVRKLKVVQ
jgi:YVTN family beta-propeller protein